MNGEGMSIGGWIMLIVGCLILYGGLAICLFRAAGSKMYSEDEEYDETEEETE